MPYDTLLFEIRGAVAHITLNRPESYNALNAALGADLAHALEHCQREDGVRAVVLSGACKAFCSGGDLKSFAEVGPGVGERVPELLDNLHLVVKTIASMDAPVIAAVNGVAAGAGVSMAAACDLVVARESATFNFAYTRAGLTPDGSSTYFLPRRIGMARTLDLALTNRTLSAAEAQEWGLVSRVVADDEFEHAVDALAAQLAAGPTRTFGAAKRLIRASWNATLDEQLDREARAFAEAIDSADGQEGITAFSQKRKPNFIGR